MSVLTGKELRIVGFLCNWCSYGGADTAGVGRFAQPTDLRIVRVPCSGRINPLFIMKALTAGADGVLVSGCHPRDCHYAEGNYYARRRLEVLKGLLPVLGIDPRRFEYTWVSASEGQRWQHVVEEFTRQVHALGPAKAFTDAPELETLLRRAGYGGNMSIQEEIQQAVKTALPDIACAIGWGAGPEALRAAPLFMRGEADVDGLHAGFLSVNNPALYLPEYKGGKVAVVVKGCDARSVGQLVQEKLVKREEVVVIGYPCQGVIDPDKVAEKLRGTCEPGEVRELREEGEAVVLVTPAGDVTLEKKDITADKCFRCRFPNALDADVFVGTARPPVVEEDDYADLAAFEALPLEERQAFWEKEMSRCIRCYACRNACPLCVCRDHCVAVSRDPHWISQADGVRDKLFFQVIHASHLAGRCTGCGECERACPVGIPVLLLKRALSRKVESLFAYRAGVDEGTPPLLTFTLEEPTIKERDW